METTTTTEIVEATKPIASPDAWKVPAEMNHLMNVAQRMAQSSLVPEKLKGKPGDILLVLQFAARSNIDPLFAMNGMYVYQGKMALHAQFAVSLANNSGIFADRIKYKIEGTGPSLKVTAYATLKGETEPVSAHASMEMANLEGWTKNGKYKSMPEQMLCYRAATFLIRRYVPEVMSGFPIKEEIDMISVGEQRFAAKDRLTSKLSD